MHSDVHRTAKLNLAGGSHRAGRGRLHIHIGVLAQHGTAGYSGTIAEDTRRIAAAVNIAMHR